MPRSVPSFNCLRAVRLGTALGTKQKPAGHRFSAFILLHIDANPKASGLRPVLRRDEPAGSKGNTADEEKENEDRGSGRAI